MPNTKSEFKKNLLSQEEMKEKIQELKKSGKKTVFTNGVFDILHIGHLTYLRSEKTGRCINRRSKQ